MRFRRDLPVLRFSQFLELQDQGGNLRYTFWLPDIPVTVESCSKRYLPRTEKMNSRRGRLTLVIALEKNKPKLGRAPSYKVPKIRSPASPKPGTIYPCSFINPLSSIPVSPAAAVVDVSSFTVSSLRTSKGKLSTLASE